MFAARGYRSSGMHLKERNIWWVQVWVQAEADKQIDLLCLWGEPDGQRYRDAAFVLQPAWRIIRPFGEWTKYGAIGTQRLVQPVCFIISPLFFCSLFFPDCASFCHLAWLLQRDTAGPQLFTLTAMFVFFDCQRGTFLHSRTLTGVAGQLHRHEWANKHSSLPSFHFSISSSLPL